MCTCNKMYLRNITSTCKVATFLLLYMFVSFFYARYPTRAQFESVIISLTTRYPALCYDLVHSDAMVSISNFLQYRKFVHIC